MTLNEIIERIGIIRTRSNLTARALSIAIGKNPSYIHLLENTKFELSITTLMDILEVCNCSAEEFFYSDLNQYKTDKQTLDFLKTLNPAQKEAIRNLYR